MFDGENYVLYIYKDTDTVLYSYQPVVVYSKDDVYHPATWVYSNAGKLKAYETKAVTWSGEGGVANKVSTVIASTSFKIEYETVDGVEKIFPAVNFIRIFN